MKNIAQAVQEGASAYLTRQFRTLGIFAAVAFVALLALPADDIGGAHRPLAVLPASAPASPPRSATWACRWPCAPTSAWPPPPTTRAATRP